ncbi:uncharacterized protein LOC135197643 [Macrobrachium nipponense]|uniref:uncharacterized protein LOC135197643 n=1 Tax=Macrobrachium nipponense TaxID=159736 RepID=UPI0030C856F1
MSQLKHESYAACNTPKDLLQAVLGNSKAREPNRQGGTASNTWNIPYTSDLQYVGKQGEEEEEEEIVSNALVTAVLFSTVLHRTVSLRAPVREYAGLVSKGQAVLIDPYEVSKEILRSSTDSSKEGSEVTTPASETPADEELPTPVALLNNPSTFRPKIYRDNSTDVTKLQNRLLELQNRVPFWRKRLGNLGLGNHGLHSGIARLGAGGVSLPSLKRLSGSGASRRRTASGILPSGITKKNVIHFLRNNRNLTTTTTMQPTIDFLSQWHNSFSRGKPEESVRAQTKKTPIDERIASENPYPQQMTTQSTADLANDQFYNNLKTKANGNKRTKPLLTSPTGLTSVHDMTSTHFANGSSTSHNKKPAVQTESQNRRGTRPAVRTTTMSPNRQKSSLPASLSKELDKSVLHDTEILESIKSIVKSASGNTNDFSAQNFQGNTSPKPSDIFSGVKPLYGFRPSYQEPSNTNQSSVPEPTQQSSVFSLTGSSNTRTNTRKPSRPSIESQVVNAGPTIIVSPPPLGHNLALQIGHSLPVLTEEPVDTDYQKIRTLEDETDIVIGRPAALIKPPPVTVPTTIIPPTLRNEEGSPIYISNDNDHKYPITYQPNIGSPLPPWYTQEIGPLLDAISKKYNPYKLQSAHNSAPNLKALVESGKLPEFFKNEHLMDYIKKDQLRFQPLNSVDRLGKPIPGNNGDLEADEKEAGITGQFVALSGLALLMAFGGYFLFSSSESVSESRGAPDPLLLAVNQARHGLKLLQQGLDEYETKLIENKDRLNDGMPSHMVFETDQTLQDVSVDLGKVWKNIQEIPNKLLFSEESPFSNAVKMIKKQIGDPEGLINSIKNSLMDSLGKTHQSSREPHSLHEPNSSIAMNNQLDPLNSFSPLELLSSSVSPQNLVLDLISKLTVSSYSNRGGDGEMRSFGKQWQLLSSLFFPASAKNVSANEESESVPTDKVGAKHKKEEDNLDINDHVLHHGRSESDKQRKETINDTNKKPTLTYDMKGHNKHVNSEDDKEEYKKDEAESETRERSKESSHDYISRLDINASHKIDQDSSPRNNTGEENATEQNESNDENYDLEDDVQTENPEVSTQFGEENEYDENSDSNDVNDTLLGEEFPRVDGLRKGIDDDSSQNLETGSDNKSYTDRTFQENLKNVDVLASHEINMVSDDLHTPDEENSGNYENTLIPQPSTENYGDLEPKDDLKLDESIEVVNIDSSAKDEFITQKREDFIPIDATNNDELNFDDKLTDRNKGDLRPTDDVDEVQLNFEDQPNNGGEDGLRPTDNSSEVEVNFDNKIPSTKETENASRLSDNLSNEMNLKGQSSNGKDNDLSFTAATDIAVLNLNDSPSARDQSDTKISDYDNNHEMDLKEDTMQATEEAFEQSNLTKGELKLKDMSKKAEEMNLNPSNDSENNDETLQSKSTNTAQDEMPNNMTSENNYMVISKDGNSNISDNAKSEQDDSPDSEVKMSEVSGISRKEIGSGPNSNYGGSTGSEGESTPSETKNSPLEEKTNLKADKTLKSNVGTKEFSALKKVISKETELLSRLIAEPQKQNGDDSRLQSSLEKGNITDYENAGILRNLTGEQNEGRKFIEQKEETTDGSGETEPKNKENGYEQESDITKSDSEPLVLLKEKKVTDKDHEKTKTKLDGDMSHDQEEPIENDEMSKENADDISSESEDELNHKEDGGDFSSESNEKDEEEEEEEEEDIEYEEVMDEAYSQLKEQLPRGYYYPGNRQTSLLQDMVARYLAHESLPDNNISV